MSSECASRPRRPARPARAASRGCPRGSAAARRSAALALVERVARCAARSPSACVARAVRGHFHLGFICIGWALRLESAPHAEVAELVDALGSGPSGGNTVGVRVPSSAPAPVSRPSAGFRDGQGTADIPDVLRYLPSLTRSHSLHSNGCRRTIVWSRSAPVEMRSIGTPQIASMRSR